MTRWPWRPKRRNYERDLEEELRDHLERQAAVYRAEGVSEQQAARRARLTFGGLEQVKEECRDVRRLPLVATAWRDLRYAVRTLRREPSFTLAALATLALGIGTTTAIFAVVNAVLLQSPPYPESDRIVALTYPDGGSQTGQIFHYVREHARSFDRVAAQAGGSGWNLVVGERAEYVTGVPVSEGFFDVLGVTPLIGRGFTRAEDQPNGPRAVVLHETVWRRLFGARPDAIGETVLLGGVPHSIVGVMPAHFRTTPAADVWTTLRLPSADNSWNYAVIGRLRAGVTLSQARSELSALKVGLRPHLRDVSERRISVMQWISYQQWLGLAGRDPLVLLLTSVLFLLLLTSVNVAGLQVVRGAARRREMATRAALGGGRGRLVQQVLVESLFLALAGAALGVALAYAGTRALATLAPARLLGGRTIALDWRVLGFALACAVSAAVFFGLTPALGAARVDLRAALWDGARQTAGHHAVWLRRTLALAEVALAVILLASAALFIRTLVNMHRAPLGFDPSHVVVGKMSLQGTAKQTSENPAAFFERTLDRIRNLPGVEAAAVGNNIPVERGLNLALDPPPGARIGDTRAVDWRYVTAGYFAVFQVPLRSGRFFDARDGSRGAPVAIVNEAFVRTYFGRSSPALGRVLQLTDTDDPPREIVGVVGDVKGRSGAGWTTGPNALGSAAPPTMYVPIAQVPERILEAVHHFFPVSWVIRTPRDADVVPDVQRAVRAAEPRLPFVRFETMREVIAADLELHRFMTALLTVFAGTSLLLAAVGMYGLVAYSLAQRRQEIGIRIALGATRLVVLRMCLVEAGVLVSTGLAIGLGAAAGVSRAFQALVFRIEPLDAATLATVAAVLIVSTGLAVLKPSLAAARTDPMHTLRLE